MKRKEKQLTSFQVISIGFVSVIFIGALLLMLPIASKTREVTSFWDTLFTATSAVCVTGLVVKDTASYWSDFGQAVILTLIQIGGMGVITVALAVELFAGKKITLMQRSTMREAIAAPKMGGIVKLTGFIIKTTFAIELFGAILLLPSFCKDYGVRGIWMSVFHSISAFCNAGFDLMGTKEAPFVSLTAYAKNPLVMVPIILLIVTGGIGFLTWDDIRNHGFRFHCYRVQSKIIIVTTTVLIVLPFVLLLFAEYREGRFSNRILYALFQSVTPRTAGFNTTDLAKLSGAGQCIIIALMLVGGSPGSTAGGMKTTTVAVLFSNMISVFLRKEEAHFFGRRLEAGVVQNAATILMLYLSLFVSAGIAISMIEDLPIGLCLFETASAVGTAGLTLGITTQLGHLSHIILMILMFLGRVGGLTLIYATLSQKNRNLSKLPEEKVTVG